MPKISERPRGGEYAWKVMVNRPLLKDAQWKADERGEILSERLRQLVFEYVSGKLDVAKYLVNGDATHRLSQLSFRLRPALREQCMSCLEADARDQRTLFRALLNAYIKRK